MGVVPPGTAYSKDFDSTDVDLDDPRFDMDGFPIGQGYGWITETNWGGYATA